MVTPRVVDLSHPLRPGLEARELGIRRVDATSITGAAPEDGWYIMHSVSLASHVGTHIEVPYHALSYGGDLGSLSADRFVGPGKVLDLRGHESDQSVPVEAVQAAVHRAGGLEAGDIVLCWTGWSSYYGQPTYDSPPFLSRGALEFLIGLGIKVLGIDTRGSMDPQRPDRENHLPLFEANVAYLENLTNLRSIGTGRNLIIALPPAIHGLEGMPVRVVAIVWQGESH